MYEYGNKEDFITSLYNEARILDSLDRDYSMLMSVEKNLSDEIFEHIEKYSTKLNVVDLNIFCLTAKTIEHFEKNIDRYDINDYKKAIDELLSNTDRIQYYSENQIRIKLPKFPLPPTTILYLFINYLKEKNHIESTINNILSFFSGIKLAELMSPYEDEIEKYGQLNADVDKPNINLSYKHILKEFKRNKNDTAYEIRSRESEKKAFIVRIDKEFKKLKSKPHNENIHSEFDKEAINYWDINSNEDILNIVKQSITYDISEHINKNKSIKIDLFCLGRFSFAVEEDKFLSESDLALEGNKLRNKIQTLKKLAQKIQYYSEDEIYIRIPMQSNINISQMIKHLKERCLDTETINYLCKIFYTRNRKPSKNSIYIKDKNEILDLIQDELLKYHNGEKRIFSLDFEKELLSESKDYYFPHNYIYSPKDKLSLCPVYEKEVQNFFNAMVS